MDILEVVDHVRELLQPKGRVSCRILKPPFGPGEETLSNAPSDTPLQSQPPPAPGDLHAFPPQKKGERRQP